MRNNVTKLLLTPMHLSPPFHSLLSFPLLSSPALPLPTFTYQHKRMREYNPIELYDVLVVERAHGVSFLDELPLHLLLPIQCLHCHGNLQTKHITNAH